MAQEPLIHVGSPFLPHPSGPNFQCYIENFLNRKYDFSFIFGETYPPSSLLAFLLLCLPSNNNKKIWNPPTLPIDYVSVLCWMLGMTVSRPMPSLSSGSFPSMRGLRRQVMGVFLRKEHQSWNSTGNQSWEGRRVDGEFPRRNYTCKCSKVQGGMLPWVTESSSSCLGGETRNTLPSKVGSG